MRRESPKQEQIRKLKQHLLNTQLEVKELHESKAKMVEALREISNLHQLTCVTPSAMMLKATEIALNALTLKFDMLVPFDPFTNKEGDMCPLCDGTTAHYHPQSKCCMCGMTGLTENMEKHNCLATP